MDIILYILKILSIVVVMMVFNYLLSIVFLGRKVQIPKGIFKLFPLMFRYYKVSEQVIKSNSPYSKDNDGITYTFYALELFLFTIPITKATYKY